MFQYHGIVPARATSDIDIAIQVASWADYETLTNDLIRLRGFSATEKPYRFQLEETLLDIIPFGKIADVHNKIAFPPEHRILMSIVGFQEAFGSSVLFRISTNPDVDIKVCSLEGLAILKLIAWDEKYPDRSKDAQDLRLIMDGYEEAEQFERLYQEEQIILEEEGFDNNLACIRLLGRDLGSIASRDALEMIGSILESEKKQHKLARDMIQGLGLFDDEFENVLQKIGKLLQGLRESKIPR